MLERYALIKAAAVVLSAPLKAFSIRGLAKTAKISPAAAREALIFLHKEEIVSLEKIGSAFQYKANLENALCRQWKILFNLKEIQKAGAVKEILQKAAGVQSILLYGSMAKGTNDEKSDFDFLVIASADKKTAWKFMERLPAEANLTIMSFGEWRKKAQKEKAFYENVIYDSIVLYGEKPVVT